MKKNFSKLLLAVITLSIASGPFVDAAGARVIRRPGINAPTESNPVSQSATSSTIPAPANEPSNSSASLQRPTEPTTTQVQITPTGGPGPVGTDLYISDVQFSPSSPQIGDRIDIAVRIENTGTINLPLVSVTAQDQTQWSTAGAVINLQGGKSKVAHLTLYAAEYNRDKILMNNPHEFRITVDPFNRIYEINENNNIRTEYLTVRDNRPPENIQPQNFDLTKESTYNDNRTVVIEWTDAVEGINYDIRHFSSPTIETDYGMSYYSTSTSEGGLRYAYSQDDVTEEFKQAVNNWSSAQIGHYTKEGRYNAVTVYVGDELYNHLAIIATKSNQQAYSRDLRFFYQTPESLQVDDFKPSENSSYNNGIVLEWTNENRIEDGTDDNYELKYFSSSTSNPFELSYYTKTTEAGLVYYYAEANDALKTNLENAASLEFTDFNNGYYSAAIGTRSGTYVVTSYNERTRQKEVSNVIMIPPFIIVHPNGTLTIAENPEPVYPKLIPAGATNVLVNRIRLYAENEDFLIKKLDVKQTLPDENQDEYRAMFPSNRPVRRVTIKYATNFNTPEVLDGVKSTFLGEAGTAEFYDVRLAAPKGAWTVLEVYVDTNDILNGVAESGDFINIAFDCSTWGLNIFEAVGDSGQEFNIHSDNIICGHDNQDIQPNPNSPAGFLRQSLPYFAVLPVNNGNYLTFGLDQDIYKFNVFANQTGDLGFSRITLNVDPSGLNTGPEGLARPNGFKLYNTTIDPSIAIATATWDPISETVSFNFPEQVINQGNTHYFVVKAPVLDNGINDPNALATSMIEDTRLDADYVTNGWQHTSDYAHISANPQQSIWNTIVWSDHSQPGHNQNTLDWTNGFLLPGIEFMRIVLR